MPFHDTATTSNSSQEKGGNTRKRKSQYPSNVSIKVWGMHVFSLHRTTDTVKLKKTLEWAGSGAEVSDVVAHCHRGQIKTPRITFVLNTLEKN